MMIKKMKSGTRNCILFVSICAFLFCQANLAFALEQDEDAFLADSVPLASLEDGSRSDVISVEMPTVSKTEDSPFNFILDPQNLIYDTNAALYGGGKVEKDAHLLFRNQTSGSDGYAFSRSSEMLSITNHGDTPMDVLITAKIENLGEMQLVQDKNFNESENCSLYLALTDSEGNLAPLSEDGTASLHVSMSRTADSLAGAELDVPTGEMAENAAADASDANAMQELLSAINGAEDANAELLMAYLAETYLENLAEADDDPEEDGIQQAGSDGIPKKADLQKYSFGLTGECNPSGNWEDIHVHPIITVSWTVEAAKEAEEESASDGTAKSDGTASDGIAKSDGTASDGVSASDGAVDSAAASAGSDGTSSDGTSTSDGITESGSSGSDGVSEENTSFSVTAAQESTIESGSSSDSGSSSEEDDSSTSSKSEGGSSSGGGGSGGKSSVSCRSGSDEEDVEGGEDLNESASDGTAGKSDGISTPDVEDETIDSAKSDGSAEIDGSADGEAREEAGETDRSDPASDSADADSGFDESASSAASDGTSTSENEEESTLAETKEKDEAETDEDNAGDAETGEDAKASVSTPSNIARDAQG